MTSHDDTRKALAVIDVKRKALETEAEAITSELTAVPPDGSPMGIDSPLVDENGYPRSDIDVYRARTLRHRLSEIKTDHKELMQQLDLGLTQMPGSVQRKDEEKEEIESRLKPKPKPKFDAKTGKWVVMNWDGSVSGIKDGDKRSFHEIDSTLEETKAAVAATGNAQQERQTQRTEVVPFARVDAVANESPAAQAGLHEGDLIVRFGDIDHSNHRDLMAIAELVPIAASNQAGIRLQVQRLASDQSEHRVTKTLNLVPRPWNGRGLLGCHIVKY